VSHDWWPRQRDGEMVGYLTDEEWGRLLEFMEACTAHCGDVILRKGSPSRSLLVVEKGEVEVFDESMGETVVLATLGEGRVVGEVGFVDGRSRTHGVRARTNCQLRRLQRESLLELVKDDPVLFAKLTIALAELLAYRFRLAVEELEPIRAFAASLKEPMEVHDYDVIESPLPEDEPESVELLKDLARKARKDLAGV
jgi:CRP-like cAMP-binding protein